VPALALQLVAAAETLQLLAALQVQQAARLLAS
jgi:hypothetical protein